MCGGWWCVAGWIGVSGGVNSCLVHVGGWTSKIRNHELENTITTLTKQLEAQSTYIKALNNSIEKLHVQLEISAHPKAHKTGKDDNDMSWTGLDEFYDTLTGHFEKQAECIINCIHRWAEGINGNIQSALAHVEKFSPLQNEERTKEWGISLALIILALIHKPDLKLPEKVRSKMSHLFKNPPDINQPRTSEPQFNPTQSPPCSTNTDSTQEIIASTPAKKPSPTSIPPLLALC